MMRAAVEHITQIFVHEISTIQFWNFIHLFKKLIETKTPNRNYKEKNKHKFTYKKINT